MLLVGRNEILGFGVHSYMFPFLQAACRLDGCDSKAFLKKMDVSLRVPVPTEARRECVGSPGADVGTAALEISGWAARTVNCWTISPGGRSVVALALCVQSLGFNMQYFRQLIFHVMFQKIRWWLLLNAHSFLRLQN